MRSPWSVSRTIWLHRRQNTATWGFRRSAS
ncbi:hypothetical protein H206_06294 [Candidatus Electrothrix aarhusensis]|uniref:Uncharacterized protein n=1 Tax=Candidatus Electrothrix aarhusensis TaxID=1859131 RepID=A0A3S3R0Z5_9BACT|nr:hypothetical protein H206_06294 [Candidatus Electrothrix aarhusensis]